MEEILEKKIKLYFKNRTKKGNGVIQDYINPNKEPTKDSIMLLDNDYLVLSSNKYVIKEQIKDLNEENEEIVMSSWVINNNTNKNIYYNTEIKYANFVNKESCMFTQSGYVANSGIIQALCDENTCVYIDKKTHASFWDGIRFSKCKTYVFKHNNLNDLEKLIINNGKGIIVVDSLYSAYGTFCPLLELCNIKKKYKCLLILDESHTLGLYGDKGSGYASMLKCVEDIDFITASLIKAFCTRAGIIFGKSEHIKFIKEKSFPAAFSSAIFKNDIVRLNTILEVIKKMDKERDYLMDISINFREKLLKNYCNVPIVNIASPIICIIFENEDEMKRMFDFLVSKNIYGCCFMYPATSLKKPILRFTMNIKITKEDINYIIENINIYNKLKQNKL